jgi:transcriptional regulator with XRE-family HTH domain
MDVTDYLFTFVITIFTVMRDRLLEFLKSENKSSAQLAEEIGVQPSGISHILSGRNNPSLDFVLKMLGKYQFLSSDWLLFGRGTMYKDIKMQSLFDEVDLSDRKTENESVNQVPERREREEKTMEMESLNRETLSKTAERKSAVTRIIMFFDDRSFEEYTPRGQT